MSVPTVKDNTGSFRLISLERIDHRFVMRVQNTSDKAITAYAKAVCDFPESSADYTLGDQSIKPGEVVTIDTPAKAVSDHCGSAKTQPTITILAVVFDDRTTAGEYQWAKGILDDRGGNRIQLKRINSLLRKAQKWPDAGELPRLRGSRLRSRRFPWMRTKLQPYEVVSPMQNRQHCICLMSLSSGIRPHSLLSRCRRYLFEANWPELRICKKAWLSS